jgi:Cu+-exporting ATPase
VQQADIVEAIEDAGFDAELLKVESNGPPAVGGSQILISHIVKARFKISGMTCSACVNSVEGALRAVKGVKSVQVALATEEAHVDYDTRVIGPQ